MGVAEHNGVRSNFNKASGKWYWEITIDSGATHFVGVATDQALLDSFAGGDEHAYSYHDLDGKKYTNGAGSAYGDAYEAGDVIGVALDLDNNEVFFSKNGVWQDSGDPAAGTDPAYTIAAGAYYAIWSGYDVGEVTANFGATAFSYTVPTGYAPFSSGTMTITWDADKAGGDLSVWSDPRIVDANLAVATCAAPSDSAYGAVLATSGKLAGKWYWEVLIDIGNTASGMTAVVPYSSIRVGIMTSAGDLEVPCGDDEQGFSYAADGKIRNGGVPQAFGDTYGDNDIIGIAVDLDEHKAWFSKNGVWQNGGNPIAGTNPAFSGLPSAMFFPCGSPAGLTAISC